MKKMPKKFQVPDLQMQEKAAFPLLRFVGVWLLSIISPVTSKTFLARKTKKKIKGIQQANASGSRDASETPGNKSIVPASLPQLTPTLVSLLEVIEPEVLYSGYDSTLPDSSWRILSTLNMLGGRQVVAAVKWAKAIPGKTHGR